VDNAVSDDAITSVMQQYPSWSLVHNTGNLGFGQANNLAAATSSADYLVFLNPDTMPTPGWLDELIRPFQENPKAALTTAKIILMSEPHLLNTAGNAVHLSGLTTCRGIRAPINAFSRSERLGAVSGACFAIRREVFDALDGFDEAFFLYMEDTDLSLRAIMTGHEIWYVPTSRVYHDYELTFGNQKIFLQERNRYLMLAKLLKWRTLLLLVPALLMGEMVSWGFVLLRERGSIGNKLRAYGWIIRHWRLVRQRRRDVQACRRIPDGELLRVFEPHLDITQFGDTLILRTVDTTVACLSSMYHRFLLRFIHW
jgi:GT2 family glycosyltransferase